MFNSFSHILAKAFVAPLVFVLSAAGYTFANPQPDYSLDISHLQQQINDIQDSQPAQSLGATNYLPQNIAFFQTSLATGISSSANSMSLVSATYNNGANTLASSTYAFVIDEGTASQEMVQADCTGTTCTNMTRGLDFLSGTSSVLSLQFLHRRGASVKITTAPTTLIMGNILAGSDSIPNPIRYANGVSTSSVASNRQNLASAGLVADLAFAGAGVINATANANGVVQLATTLQGASSTAIGSSGAALVLPASSATSTYNANTSALRVVVTQNSGKIDPNFIATTTLGLASLSAPAFTGSTTINTTVPLGVTSTTTAVLLNSITLSNIPSSDILDIQIMASSSSSGANTGFYIYFNNDTSNTYNYQVVGKGFSTTASASSSLLTNNLVISQGILEYDNFSVLNYPSNPKIGWGHSIYNSIGNTYASSTSAFSWNNYSDRITSVTIKAYNGGQFMTGSFIRAIGMSSM